MNWLNNDSMREWNTDAGARFGIAGLAALAMMFVSMILDMATGLPTNVWVGLWIAVPVFLLVFPSVAWLHPVNRVNNTMARNALSDYYRLPRSERRHLPANFADLLSNRDIPDHDRERVAREGQRLMIAVRERRNQRFNPEVNMMLEEIAETNKSLHQDIDIHNEVMRELA